MSGVNYLDQATIDDARNARGFGVPLDRIAGHLGVSVEQLEQALGIPTKPKPEPEARQLSLWTNVRDVL